jgi:hypothetical protein
MKTHIKLTINLHLLDEIYVLNMVDQMSLKAYKSNVSYIIASVF